MFNEWIYFFSWKKMPLFSKKKDKGDKPIEGSQRYDIKKAHKLGRLVINSFYCKI